MRKPSKTYSIYMARLVGRIVIFVFAVFMYFFHYQWLTDIMTDKFFSSFTPFHILWAILMAGMILHLLPKVRITMSGLKSRPYTYRAPKEGYDRLKLLEYVQSMNIRAWTVLLIWICGNSIIGILYFTKIIGTAELLMLTLFYYTSDSVCMMIFCPFQKFIMGNRCCVNCRIFDWGHMMMYTPMVLIPSFFSWSLLFMAIIVAIRWELTYANHPERFWRGSNESIRCENCVEKMCYIKRSSKSSTDL